jgi:hypothetical protein
MARKHCWHATGITKTMDPPITMYRCCHCGADGSQRSYYVTTQASPGCRGTMTPWVQPGRIYADQPGECDGE